MLYILHHHFGGVVFQLERSPYSLGAESMSEAAEQLRHIEDRVALLRSQGTLTQDTLRDYYGSKRFEQVAESNALEGSTLNVGETEVAIMKGITITGHDPAYVRDAVALDKALNRVVEIARSTDKPTDIEQLLEVHSLLLGGRPGGGVFRTERVAIRGSDHTPPRTWSEVMTQMEAWEAWSRENASAPAPFRAAVLHAWITHVHPFIDGNGRVSRAIGNLELVRSGYPTIIIKKKERDRYIEALAESDRAGDLRSFIDLIFSKADGALTGLELAARKSQGYDPVLARLQRQQEQQLQIWSTGVKLLASIIDHRLTERMDVLRGQCFVRIFDNYLDVEDYVDLIQGRSISGGWAFIVNIQLPGMPRLEKLAFVGHRSARMYQQLGHEGGPSLHWSRANPEGFPRWTRDHDDSPFAIEATARTGSGDEWIAMQAGGKLIEMNTSELATAFADALLEQAVG